MNLNFLMKWAARPLPFVWADGRIYIHTFSTINLFYYILSKGPAHVVQGPTGKTGAPDGQTATGQPYGLREGLRLYNVIKQK